MRTNRIDEARKIQERLKEALILSPLDAGRIKTVCGVDVSYLGDRKTTFATAVVLSFPGLALIEEKHQVTATDFPYIPGYLAFREIPAIMNAIALLSTRVDVFLVDGHGMAHPRRFGIASHLGVSTGLPTVGCAKKRLVGEYEEPSKEKGAYTYLYHRDEKVGAVVRTREGKKPVFVSPGHLSDIESAVDFALATVDRYRIPEPTRRAHSLTVKIRGEFKESGIPRKRPGSPKGKTESF